MDDYDWGTEGPFDAPDLGSVGVDADSYFDAIAEAAASEGARGPRVLEMRARRKGLTLVDTEKLKKLLALAKRQNVMASNWRALGDKSELGGSQALAAGNSTGSNTITVTGAGGAFCTYLRLSQGGTAPGVLFTGLNVNNNRLDDAIIVTPQQPQIVPMTRPVKLENSSTIQYSFTGLGALADTATVSLGLGFANPGHAR